MFYDTYETLCKKNGKKPYAVAREIGLGNSNVAQWKKGSTPRPDVLEKIAGYFGVTAGYLLGNKQTEKPTGIAADGLSQEERDYLDWFRGASDMEKEMVRRIMNGGRE